MDNKELLNLCNSDHAKVKASDTSSKNIIVRILSNQPS